MGSILGSPHFGKLPFGNIWTFGQHGAFAQFWGFKYLGYFGGLGSCHTMVHSEGDGSVVTWGDAAAGGDSSRVQKQLVNVRQLKASEAGFAAILEDGSLLAWGGVSEEEGCIPLPENLTNVTQVQACERAFAAIRSDGSVVTWGGQGSGGDSTAVQSRLRDVQQIQAARFAFAAILKDGSVVTWGNRWGGGDSSAVTEPGHGQSHFVPPKLQVYVNHTYLGAQSMYQTYCRRFGTRGKGTVL